MKLIKCHIENYGKLSNTDYAFEGGLTSFCFGNGYGKTTLASFIKAMLYGLKPVRTNSKDFDDRRKYYPFSGGKFGGSLTLELDGRAYRIERFFDVKSDTKDTLAVYLSGALTDELGENIGERVFGLDSESFERTLFMSSQDSAYGTTQTVSARLGGLAMGDGTDLKAALSRLEDTKKQLRAARGKNDLITKELTAITDAEDEIANIKAMQSELDRLYVLRAEQSAEASRLEAAEHEENSRRVLEEKRNTYIRYKEELAAKRAQADALSAKYPKGLPSEQTVADASALAVKIDRQRAVLSHPTAEDKRTARLEELKKVFDGSSVERDLAELNSGLAAQSEAERRSTSGGKGAEKPKAMPTPNRLMLIGGALLLCSAVLLAILSQLLAAGLLGAGGALILLSAFLLGNARDSQAKNNSDAEMAESTERKAEEILSGYGLVSGRDYTDIKDGIGALNRMSAEYSFLLGENAADAGRREGAETEISRAEAELAALLGELSYFDNECEVRLAEIYREAPARLLQLLSQCEVDRGLLASLMRDIAAIGERAERYRAENAIDESSAAPIIAHPAEGARALAECRAALARTDKEIAEIEVRVEALPECQSRLDIAKENLAALKHRHGLLEQTILCLKEAERNLSEKYISPVRERFIGYASRIEASIGESYTMDRDFNIRFEAGGESRDERHLSQGQHAVVAMALRLSLIDSMYQADAPFIILDDPFASLDEEYLEKMRLLISDIAKTHQIVYFSCHNSRKM